MSNNKWRFDPCEDYSRDDYGNERQHGRKGIASMKNHKQHHNADKFDGKRMKRDNNRHRDNRHW